MPRRRRGVMRLIREKLARNQCCDEWPAGLDHRGLARGQGLHGIGDQQVRDPAIERTEH